LKAIGEFDGEIGALAGLAGGIGTLISAPAHLFDRLEQPVQVLRQELLAQSRIGARPRELFLSDQLALAFEKRES
jgi:hypothetical protein